ncbi:CbtA family protein, partial [Streptomyces sp. NPDC054787]
PLAAGGGSAAGAALALEFMPAHDDAVKPGFPAAVLWEFRIASLAVQLVLWAVFAIVFGVLAQRLLAVRADGAEATAQRNAPALG